MLKSLATFFILTVTSNVFAQNALIAQCDKSGCLYEQGAKALVQIKSFTSATRKGYRTIVEGTIYPEEGPLPVALKKHANGTFYYQSPSLTTSDLPFSVSLILEDAVLVDSLKETLAKIDARIVEILAGLSEGSDSEAQIELGLLQDQKNQIAQKIVESREVLSTQTVVFRTDAEVISRIPEASAGQLTVSGYNLEGFNSIDSLLEIAASGVNFKKDLKAIQVRNNGNNIDAEKISISGNNVLLTGILLDGRNQIEIQMLDSEGKTMQRSVVIYAGSRTLEVIVKDSIGNILPNASVRAAISFENSFFEQKNTGLDGVVRFLNVPNMDINLEATMAGARVNTNSSLDSVELIPLLDEEPTTPNLDFSNGDIGWDTSSGGVTVVSQEDVENFRLPMITAKLDRNRLSSFYKKIGFPKATNCQAIKCNLQIKTNGKSSAWTRHTFVATSSVVSLRYKFITTEYAAGFYSEKWDDSYGVTIRVLGGVSKTESKTIRSLGIGAYGENGETVWRTISLGVNPGDTVEVYASVANAGDEKLDSLLVLETISNQDAIVAEAEINKNDGQRLKALSMGHHPYLEVENKLKGRLKFKTTPGDTIRDISVQINWKGQVYKTLPVSNMESSLSLPADAAGIISGTFDIDVPGEHFPEKIDTTVSLSMTVTNQLSQISSIQIYDVLPILFYSGADFVGKRFGDRMATLGGDDWMLPSVLEYVKILSNTYSLQVGSMSPINGGAFNAASTVLSGQEAEFSNLSKYNLSADASLATHSASTIIQIINDPVLKYAIESITVGGTTTPEVSNAFWKRISIDPLAAKKVVGGGQRQKQFLIKFKSNL